MPKTPTKKARLALWIMTVCGIVLLALAVIFLIFSAFTAQSRNGKSITFMYGVGSRRDASVEGKRSVYLQDGVTRCNFTLLAKAMRFSQSGDLDEIRYVIELGNDRFDTVTFYYNSRKAVVNGAHITLSAPVRLTENAVMVPCEFITQYMNGVTVELTDERIRVIYEEGGVSLKPSLHPITPIEPKQ